MFQEVKHRHVSTLFAQSSVSYISRHLITWVGRSHTLSQLSSLSLPHSHTHARTRARARARARVTCTLN